MKFVQSSSSEVTAENLKVWLKSFVEDIQPGLLKLDAFYKAKDKIDKGRQKVDDRPDNKIHVNLAKMITRNATSYFIGKPVTYSFKDNFPEKDKIEKVLFDNSENQENKSLAKDSSKFGIAYELIGKGDDGLIYFKNLSPLTTFQVVDSSLLENPICVVTFLYVESSNGTRKVKGWVYDDSYIYEFSGDESLSSLQFSAVDVNPFHPKIPVTVFRNNDDLTGDYEDVTELLTAYSRLMSNNFDDIEGILNALLIFYETDIDEEEKKKFQRSRVVQLISTGDKQARAEFLSKQLDEAYCEYLREAIREDIFTITNVPDFTDEKFAGNQSGVALAYKLIGFENLRLDKESYFRSALENRLELILSYQQFKVIILNKGQVDIQFYPNLPANIDKDAKIAELHSLGAISQETMVENLEIVKDKEQELERLSAERPRLEGIDES